jgi:hypothetical protein
MNKTGMLLTGMGIGAGLMYILDPDRGRRRRALARDKAVRTWNRSERYVGKVSRDLANRTRGLAHETKRAITGEEHDEGERKTAPDLRNENWSPATRVVAAALGGGVAIYGYKRGGLLGRTATALGMGLLTRGLMNRSIPMLRRGVIGKAGDKVASIVGSGIESITHGSERESRGRAEGDGKGNPYGPLSPLTPTTQQGY